MIQVSVLDATGRWRRVCYDRPADALAQVEELMLNERDPRTEEIIVTYLDDES